MIEVALRCDGTRGLGECFNRAKVKVRASELTEADLPEGWTIKGKAAYCEFCMSKARVAAKAFMDKLGLMRDISSSPGNAAKFTVDQLQVFFDSNGNLAGFEAAGNILSDDARKTLLEIMRTSRREEYEDWI